MKGRNVQGLGEGREGGRKYGRVDVTAELGRREEEAAEEDEEE